MSVTGGTTVTLWVDGFLAATNTTATYAGNIGDVDIGDFPSGRSNYWRGSIDEVAIWNGARYQTTFTPPTAPYTGTEAGLRALYHLDADGSSPITLQSMSNGAGVSFSGARGVNATSFTGWPISTITAGNVYCFALSAPSTITGLTAKVVF